VANEEILVFLHLLGAFMIAAGVGLGEIVLAGMRRSRSTAAILALLNAGSRVPMMTIPGALIAVVFGSWLVVRTGHRFGEVWLSISYLAWLLAIGLSATVLSPAQRRLHALAEAELAAGREESPALQTAVRESKMAMASHAIAAMLILFLVLMVFRPGA
jgi:uncharacterized membrane protein